MRARNDAKHRTCVRSSNPYNTLPRQVLLSLFSEKLSLGGVKDLLRAVQRTRGDLVLPTACVTTAFYAASPSGEAPNSALLESASSTRSTQSVDRAILTSKSELGASTCQEERQSQRKRTDSRRLLSGPERNCRFMERGLARVKQSDPNATLPPWMSPQLRLTV